MGNKQSERDFSFNAGMAAIKYLQDNLRSMDKFGLNNALKNRGMADIYSEGMPEALNDLVGFTELAKKIDEVGVDVFKKMSVADKATVANQAYDEAITKQLSDAFNIVKTEGRGR